jgi:hypothetical protein
VTELDQYIALLVDAAPALTDEQRDRLAALLQALPDIDRGNGNGKAA